jgi:two-component sensor histidine kinase
MSSLELLPDGGVAAERLLLRELAHRIDDELASAIDLVSKAAGHCDGTEAKATLASVQDRLESHARLCHLLQLPQFTTAIDLAAYLQQLCRSISRSSLEAERIALSLLLHPLKMSSERCWLLGMIVFELITNAARHVSHGGAGAIHLEVWGTATSIACCVTYNGTFDESRYREQDRSIVEMLAANLHGTVDMSAGPEGTRTVVNVPRQSQTAFQR